MRTFLAFLFALVLLPCLVEAEDISSNELSDFLFADGVSIDLRNPEIQDGTLSTEEGGVISAPGIRIQAKKLVIRRIKVDEEAFFNVRAECDLLLEYNDQIITGDFICYDFHQQRGVVYHARLKIGNWYAGASSLFLLPGGNYLLDDGYISASLSKSPDWRLCTSRAYISKSRTLFASHPRLCIVNLPILWFPFLWTPLDWIVDNPLSYRVRWGGHQGLRLGVGYQFLNWPCLDAFLRFDYRLSRGPGVAVETIYRSPNRDETFLTRNYVARDSSIQDPTQRNRYRLQGCYKNCLCGDLLTVRGAYDKISDKDMPFDYCDHDFDLPTYQRTELTLRSQSPYSIADLRTRIRVNNFETVKEELPSASLFLKPFTVADTGTIVENYANFGYYEFKFSKDVPNTTDFNSTRSELSQNLYRSFKVRELTFTPKAGWVAIFYGNSSAHNSKWVTVGDLGAEFTTFIHRYYGRFKHVIEPYLNYQHLTTPNTNPDEHFIFDINDGWYRLNTIRWGARSLLYEKLCNGCVAHRLTADVYAYAFPDTKTLRSAIPRTYANLIWDVHPRLRQTLAFTWNQSQNALDEFNAHTLWTLSDDLAVDAEYRHRGPYCWRKADPLNFVVDSFRDVSTLRASGMSDKRDTVLLHGFYRMTHDLALEAQYRWGWGRSTQPDYTEYQIDITKTFRSSWHMRLSYQNRENDHRVAVHLKMGLRAPRCQPCAQPYCAGLE